MTTNEILHNAKKASFEISLKTTQEKKEALISMADSIVQSSFAILKANEIDMKNAKGKISDVMLDRLMLTNERIVSMANDMKKVALLNDPVGKVLKTITRKDGLQIKKVSVPLGVIGIIYESRPNVTSDASSLSLMSGNACVLRCGKDSFNSCNEIVKAQKQGLINCGFDENAVNLIEDTTHESANEMMTANGLIDLLIPRGGKGLISACVKNATVPCIETGTGICHIFVEKTADFNMALKIIENAKTSRPSVCNAEEVLLVDKNIANEFLPKLKEILVDNRKENKVELRCDERAYEIIGGKKATKVDFDTEFLDYILAVKVVDDTENAISHILKHSTKHSEAIITNDELMANLFTSKIDSAAVYVNASTRFTDGGEFGLGCEMGISTQKLHARGPMGLEELTTYKYIINGNGNIR